ncbi:glycosyltransferase family 39 protein [Mycobacterium deserti]|uniref:Glycosyltransferase family 39 protein n=1 Tax=Mycobacterium deserti TaxID=2978347 RepID=A0ABT2MIU0_9MYCO|nr:glycosyltransferase family 39 protein [Mycobacterium deserti]MCT7661901.1 glycosyltransferase family 39 protein [Mycobacterium deserti]
MTTAPIDTATEPVAPFAARLVLPIAALVTVLHCAAATFGGFWFDEVYMLAIGRHHLDWGSADQPPLAPALAAAMDAIAPGSVLALRLPAVLATAAAVVMAGLIARELGCDRRAQGFVAAAQATVGWTALAGHWLTPYALEPVQWLLLIWLLVRWVRVRDDRLLLVLGVVAGIAGLTKFQVLLLCVVLLAAVAAVGPRDLLRRPLLWAGAGITALLVTPTLMWQHAHGWPQLQMAPVVAGEAGALYGGRAGIAIQLIVFAGVAGAALALSGLWWVFRDEALRNYRFLGVAVIALYVLVVATAGRPYYLAGLYAPLAAAGALGMQRRRADRPTRARWLVWPTYATSVALAVGMLTLSVMLVRGDTGENIAGRTADAYRALPEAQRERTAIIGESYILAAFVDGYARRYRLPEAYSTNRSYGYFPPPTADKDCVLFIGRDPGALRPFFAEVRDVGDVGADMDAFLLTGRQRPWHEIWSQSRTLTVS